MNAETALSKAAEIGRIITREIRVGRTADDLTLDQKILASYLSIVHKFRALPSSQHELRVAGEFALADGHELPPSLLELWALHGKQVREAKRLDRALKIRAKLAELGALVFVGVCYFGIHHTALTLVLEIAGVL